jgi:hypothetical protein
MPAFRRLSGKNHNSVYKDLEDGEYDSVTFGARRFIDLASYRSYIERARTGEERPPAEKRAAQRAYQKSLRGPGGQNAARAREAIRRSRGAVSAERGIEPAILARPRA